MTVVRQNSLVILAALLLFPCVGLAASPVRMFIAEDRLEEALPLCRQYELLSASDTENELACGWVYLRLNKLDSAEKSLFRLQKKVGLPEYQLLLAFSKIQKKQFDSARAGIDAVARQYKGTGIGLVADELSAELYEAKGQLEAAAFIYRQIIGIHPDRPRAHWGLGRYYLGRGDLGKAKLHLEETAKRWPKHVASRFNLGVLCLSQENLKDAGIWLSEAYKLNRADPDVLEQLGLLFEKRNQPSEAVAYWERALALNKNATMAKEKLGAYVFLQIDRLVETGDYEEALSRIQKSGKEIERDTKLLYRRGLIYKALSTKNKSRALAQKAAADLVIYINQVPSDIEATRELGIVYVGLGQLAEAARLFEKVIREEPSNGINYAWYGFVLEGRKDFEKAQAMYRKALETLKDPAEVEKANRKLATIEKKLGKKE